MKESIDGRIESKFLDAQGVRLYYEIVKGNPSIVYLHGNSTNHTVFNYPRAHFHSLGFGSLAPDLRGDGKSRHVQDIREHSLNACTSDLERLVDAEGIGKATIVGHSKGAMIAQDYTVKHPEKVDSLVLISALSNPKGTFLGNQPNWRMKLSARTLWTLLPLIDFILDAYNRVAGLCQKDRDGYYADFSSPRFREIGDVGFMLDLYGKNSPEFTGNQYVIGKAVNEWNTEVIAPKIQAPTLLIQGECDPLVPLKTVYEMQEMIPGAKYFKPVIVPNARHTVHFRAPEQVTKAMERFLGEIYSGKITRF